MSLSASAGRSIRLFLSDLYTTGHYAESPRLATWPRIKHPRILYRKPDAQRHRPRNDRNKGLESLERFLWNKNTSWGSFVGACASSRPWLRGRGLGLRLLVKFWHLGFWCLGFGVGMSERCDRIFRRTIATQHECNILTSSEPLQIWKVGLSASWCPRGGLYRSRQWSSWPPAQVRALDPTPGPTAAPEEAAFAR